MKPAGLHLTERELIMAGDGELTSARVAEVEAHLTACWSCRERSDTLERAVTGFVRERRMEFDCRTPSRSGPQALLRARLAEASRSPLSGMSRFRAIRRGAPAVLATGLGIMAAIAFFTVGVSADGPRPSPRLTPGETRSVTLDEICRNPRAEVVTMNIPEDLRRRVFSEYGVHAQPRNFEVDYLITPDLGGAFSMRNLWPQPYSTRWNAHVKDLLEQRLHDLVCEGKVDLPTAQRDIAADWIGAYRKYFHTSRPPEE